MDRGKARVVAQLRVEVGELLQRLVLVPREPLLQDLDAEPCLGAELLVLLLLLFPRQLRQAQSKVGSVSSIAWPSRLGGQETAQRG